MKKFLVKTLSVALCGALALSAFGCGGKSEKSTILIGGSGPLTGTTAIYGQAVENALKIAIDEINAAGGANGLKFSLDFRDDENNATKATSAYNGLMDKKIQLSVGTVTTTPMNAIKKAASEDNIFVLTPSATGEDAVQYDNAFRVCFSDPSQGTVAAKYIAENLTTVKKIGILYDSADAYSTGIKDNFVKANTDNNYGFNILPAQSVDDKMTEFTTQLGAVKEADLILLPIYYGTAAAIIKYAKGSMTGFENKIFFGCDGLDGIAAQFDATNKDLLSGVKYMTSFDAAAASSKAFVDKYKELHKEIPNQFAANAYDAVYIFKALMEKADIKDVNISATKLCDAFKAAITAKDFSFTGITGAGIKWQTNGEPDKAPIIVAY